jgi:uncharacterized protein involved in exopolysaccharide biosynthesis
MTMSPETLARIADSLQNSYAELLARVTELEKQIAEILKENE